MIDADVLAREVVEPGTPGLASVLDEFGSDLIDADGRLDRAALGRIVFEDPTKRGRLEAILHPLIRARAAERQRELAASGHSIVVHEIPLLVETGQADGRFDLVVVVSTPIGVQRRRLMTGRGMSASEADARIASQATDGERRAAAGLVIENDTDEATLRRRTIAAIETIRGLVQQAEQRCEHGPNRTEPDNRRELADDDRPGPTGTVGQL